jgi:hypothetical protein
MFMMHALEPWATHEGWSSDRFKTNVYNENPILAMDALRITIRPPCSFL